MNKTLILICILFPFISSAFAQTTVEPILYLPLDNSPNDFSGNINQQYTIVPQSYLINYEIVWDVVKNKIPELHTQIKSVLDSNPN